MPDIRFQQQLMRLDIYEHTVLRTSFEQGVPMSVCEVSPDDLALALADVATTPVLLPPSVVFCGRSGTGYRLGIYLPMQSCAVLHVDGKEEFRIPLPPLLFAGCETQHHIFALAGDDWPVAATELYHAPFPNVFPNGRICHGSVEFPPVSPGTMHSAADLFLASAFNKDLANGSSAGFPKNVLDLWNTLHASPQPFPSDDLQPMHRTLGDFLRQEF